MMVWISPSINGSLLKCPDINKMQNSINLGRKIILKLFLIHCDLQGHLRSKVKVPNECQIMTSYLKLIVNVCLYGTILKISAIQQFIYYLIYLIVMAN